MKTTLFIAWALCPAFLFSNLTSKNMRTNTINSFIAAINAHNVSTIGSLITDNHVFMDAHGKNVTGKQQAIEAWSGYFSWFPDYKIEVESMLQNNDTLAVFGYASGTYAASTDTNAHWRLPASWRVVIHDNKVAEWQVYADTKIPFEIMDRYAASDTSKKITGLGGVFFKSADPKAICHWYDENLGTQFGKSTYMAFEWRPKDNKEQEASTAFGIFNSTSKYFDPSTAPFMLNFRVNNLKELLDGLKQKGIQIVGDMQEESYGKFGWIVDPDGNKIELWEPVD